VSDVNGESNAAGDGRGTSFVAEDWDEEGNPSGLFDAHWESDDGAKFREGPRGVTENEAVDWARRQAPIVMVHTMDGDEYSAGTEAAADVPRRWPAGGLTFAPRPLATHWEMAIRVPAGGPFAASSGAPFRDLVGGSPAVTATRLTTRDDGTPWLMCVIEARSSSDAARRIDELLSAGGFYDDRPDARGATYEVTTQVLGPVPDG
jgi:hypothetical protein